MVDASATQVFQHGSNEALRQGYSTLDQAHFSRFCGGEDNSLSFTNNFHGGCCPGVDATEQSHCFLPCSGSLSLRLKVRSLQALTVETTQATEPATLLVLRCRCCVESGNFAVKVCSARYVEACEPPIPGSRNEQQCATASNDFCCFSAS